MLLETRRRGEGGKTLIGVPRVGTGCSAACRQAACSGPRGLCATLSSWLPAPSVSTPLPRPVVKFFFAWLAASHSSPDATVQLSASREATTACSQRTPGCLPERWLPWCAALEGHCAKQRHNQGPAQGSTYCPDILRELSINCHLQEGINPLCNHSLEGVWGVIDGPSCFSISQCKLSKSNQ